MARGEVDFSLNFAAPLDHPNGRGRTGHCDRGGACRMLRVVRRGRHPQHCGSEGEERRRARRWDEPACLPRCMAAHVGLDPVKDIRWVVNADPSVKPMDLFTEGKIDAFLGFPPEPQELRARHIGQVIVNSCGRPAMVGIFLLHAGGQSGIHAQSSGRHERALRAILKATDLCATEPARPRGGSSMAGSPRGTTMRCRR